MNCSLLCYLARDRAVCRSRGLEDVSRQTELNTIVQNLNMVVSVMEVAVVPGTDSQTQMPTQTQTQTADTDFAQAQEVADPDTSSSKLQHQKQAPSSKPHPHTLYHQMTPSHHYTPYSRGRDRAGTCWVVRTAVGLYAR